MNYLQSIKPLKIKKSLGYDKFNIFLIKNTAELCKPVPAHITNLSFVNRIFPDRLINQITLVLKKNSNKLYNLRPVSLLLGFSKIIGKLLIYPNETNIFSINHIDFTIAKPTETHSLTFSNTPMASKTKKLKVFIYHPVLFIKMEAAGVRDVAHNCFISFLNRRSQQFRIRK